MGRNRNTKFLSGSKTNRQLTFKNYQHDSKVEKISNDYNEKQMYEKLDKAKVKYNKGEVVFVTKDEINNVIWLEKGNDNKGLKHIVDNHKDDFKRCFNINEKEIPNYLNKIISEGKIVKNELKNVCGRDGYERIYYYKGNYYMLVAIGTNGFIITAYPIKKKRGAKKGVQS